MIIDELFEGPQLCPECGGISFSDLILAEKKDACYYKVKASAKVWPSAYASGRLVQCRKKGAANYGKSKTEGVAEGSGKNVVKSVKVGNFRHDLVDTGMGWQVRIYNGDELYDTGLSKNSEQKGLASLEDAVAYTEKQTNTKRQGVAEQQELDEKWSQKYKSSINCANPQGFSQKAHCAGRKKNEDVAELDEGGDVFMPNIKDTAEYRAGLATGKLPVPYPEGTQQYASYYKGVIDRASPTLAKVGEGEQQPGADYRDPPEADYGPEYQDMVARVKKLAGLGPMKTVYDPAKRVYKNVPTAVQPKK